MQKKWWRKVTKAPLNKHTENRGIDGPLVNGSDAIWIATIDKAVIGTNYIEFEFKNDKKKKIEIDY